MIPNGDGGTAEFKSQHPFAYALIFVGPILSFICGAGMLRGFNWARWILVLYFGYNVINSMVRGQMVLLLLRLIFLLPLFLLFRPQANAFFRGLCAVKLETPPDKTHAA